MAVDTPVEVGFAEFVARLMSEVFDSVITSQVDQEQRYAAMLAAASLTREEYRRQYIDDDNIDAELIRLFPSQQADQEHLHMIWENRRYTPAKGEVAENPPIFVQTAVVLEKMDILKTANGLALAPSAVQKVREAAALFLAEGQLAIAKQLVARGLPRVVVDAGRINGKLTFNLTQASQTETPAVSGPQPTTTTSDRFILMNKSIFSLPKARILPEVRVMVKQADAASPQSSQVKANVYGEVEITFKTVT